MELPRGKLSDLPITCFVVTTAGARALSASLSDEGFEPDELSKAYVLGYHVRAPDGLPDAVVWFGPLLPHGEWIVSGFG